MYQVPIKLFQYHGCSRRGNLNPLVLPWWLLSPPPCISLRNLDAQPILLHDYRFAIEAVDGLIEHTFVSPLLNPSVCSTTTNLNQPEKARQADPTLLHNYRFTIDVVNGLIEHTLMYKLLRIQIWKIPLITVTRCYLADSISLTLYWMYCTCIVTLIHGTYIRW